MTLPKLPAGKTTTDIIASLLVASGKGIDLMLSPGHRPHVKLHGKIVAVNVPGIDTFSLPTSPASPPTSWGKITSLYKN